MIAGDLHVTRRTASHEEALLHVAGPGFWTGRMTARMRCEHVVSVVAQADVAAVELGSSALADLVRERLDFLLHLAGLAVSRHAMLVRQPSELLALDEEELLRAHLADLIDARHVDEPGGG